MYKKHKYVIYVISICVAIYENSWNQDFDNIMTIKVNYQAEAKLP